MKKLYVGNLPFTATEDEVREMFGQHGNVHSVALINDRETGRPRGFGFVEVDDDALQNMISNLDGQEMVAVRCASTKPRIVPAVAAAAVAAAAVAVGRLLY